MNFVKLLKEKGVLLFYSSIYRLKYKIKSRKKLSKYYFSFNGEFGYEILIWIPFLNFISEKYNQKLNIICRPGCEFLYQNLASDISIYEKSVIGDGFGNIKCQRFKKPTFTLNEHFIKYTDITIIDVPFLNKDIHKHIDTKFYKFPNIEVDINLPFKLEEKYIVLNNKQHFNWGDGLRNFYNYEELKIIIDKLLELNYQIVYNDPNSLVYDPSSKEDSKENQQKVIELIKSNDKIINLSDYDDSDISKRNKLQFRLWKNAEFIIGVHGGSVYLPAFLGKNQLIVFRNGNYFDFLELSRITNTKIKCFYEVKQLINEL